MRLAHTIAAFVGAAQVGKLKELEAYLSRKAASGAMSDDDLMRKVDKYFDAYEAHARGR